MTVADNARHADDEPYVPVSAGTIAKATRQLDIFAALIDPLSSCLRAHLRTVLATRGHHDASNAISWLRTTTASTSHDLTESLHDAGIVVDDDWPYLNHAR